MTFTVTKEALREIQRLSRASECEQPVVAFGSVGATKRANNELRQALRRDSTEDELRDIAERAVPRPSLESSHLTVQIFERTDFNDSQVADVQGIAFLMSRVLLDRFDGVTLDYASNNKFFMRDSNNTPVDPISLLSSPPG